MRRYFFQKQIDRILSEGRWTELPTFGPSRLTGQFMTDGTGKVCYHERDNTTLFVFATVEEARSWHANFVGPDVNQTMLEVEGNLRAGTLTHAFRAHFRDIAGISTLDDALRYLRTVKGADVHARRALRFLLICCLTANAATRGKGSQWLLSLDHEGDLNTILFQQEERYLHVGWDMAGIHRQSNYSLRNGLVNEVMKADPDWQTREQILWVGDLVPWPQQNPNVRDQPFET